MRTPSHQLSALIGPGFPRNVVADGDAFPRPHQLTAALAKMSPEDQDIVHDFLLKAAKEGINLRDVLPKPATAEALLVIARC